MLYKSPGGFIKTDLRPGLLGKTEGVSPLDSGSRVRSAGMTADLRMAPIGIHRCHITPVCCHAHQAMPMRFSVFSVVSLTEQYFSSRPNVLAMTLSFFHNPDRRDCVSVFLKGTWMGSCPTLGSIRRGVPRGCSGLGLKQ